ncbi:hypothetical protein QAD02_001079 [Eretmocerus hayati]|uniref:Uncharacterized protein n=1 Tax=Eretmocerus hayati TaxID=131215 RepID=A0ACC2NF47_9HYME|nr:hypothetical protein QAD02_001079 [Eretmocerus hayati]
MITANNKWGRVSYEYPKMENYVKIGPEEHCRWSPVKMEEYPFLVRVQIKCYDDSQKTKWAGGHQHYCVLSKADQITCRYPDSWPGDFCDATAELVADGSIHEVKLIPNTQGEYKYYELDKPIGVSSKAKPTGIFNMVGDFTIPAVLMTVMPTVGEKYGLVYTENVIYTGSDSCTGSGNILQSACNPSRYSLEFHKTRCLSRYDFMIVLVQGKLAGIIRKQEQ